MQRLVALKVSSDRGFEPQTLAQLDHPHIVRVFDQRQLPERQLRLLYMQYIPGGTLQSVNDHARRCPAGAQRPDAAGRHRCHPDAQRRNGAGRLAGPLPAVAGQLARGGDLGRGAAGCGPGLCARARRAASRRQTGQRAGFGRGQPQAGRFQHQFLEARRGHAGGVFRRQPGLHVARAAGSLRPGPRPAARRARRPQRRLCARRAALGNARRPAALSRGRPAGRLVAGSGEDERPAPRGPAAGRPLAAAGRLSARPGRRAGEMPGAPSRPIATRRPPSRPTNSSCACSSGRGGCCTVRKAGKPSAGGIRSWRPSCAACCRIW